MDFERDLTAEHETLDAMTKTMTCRGPDASGGAAWGARVHRTDMEFVLQIDTWLRDYRVSLDL